VGSAREAGAATGALEIGPRLLASSRLRLPCELISVNAASTWIRRLAEQSGLDPDEAFHLDLCLVEVVTNALSYGGLDVDSPPIELACDITTQAVHCSVIDAGGAFDPVNSALPALPGSLEDGAAGGAGMRLLREFADSCDYARVDDRNVLRFTVRRRNSVGAVREHWLKRGIERRFRRALEPKPKRDASGEPIAQRRTGHDRRALGFISQVRLFRGAPYGEIEPIIAQCRREQIAAGEIWLAPGQRSPDVAVVLSGRLRVHVERTDSIPNFIIDMGHCAGEMQLLDGKPASAYVIADVDSELLLIPGEMLREELLAIPQVAANLLSILAGRIRRSDKLIADQVRASMELERLQREIKVAQEIQLSMLPDPPLLPDLPQVDCVGFIRAAKDVGGDFYDAFLLDANHLFITIGDICGKGLPSSLFMVRTLTTLWNEAARRRNVQRIVELVNKQLCNNNDTGLFASLFCGVLDLTTRNFTYVNAGHNPPLLAIGDAPLRALAEPRNLVVGIAAQSVYRSATVGLPEGCLLVLYTDGVTESESTDQRWFGEERLAQVVDAQRSSTPAALVERLVQEVDDFARGAVQADDITLLALRINTYSARAPGHTDI